MAGYVCPKEFKIFFFVISNGPDWPAPGKRKYSLPVKMRALNI
jgi:hypothetical protein